MTTWNDNPVTNTVRRATGTGGGGGGSLSFGGLSGGGLGVLGNLVTGGALLPAQISAAAVNRGANSVQSWPGKAKAGIQRAVSTAKDMVNGGGGGGGGGGEDTTGPMPTLGNFNSMLDPATGMLKSQYLMNSSQNWLNPQLQKQAALQTRQMGDAAAQANSGAAMARGQLAARAGLTSGAAERLASGAANNLNLAKQNVGFEGNQARLGIESKGADLARADQQSNIQNALGEVGNQRAYDMTKYQEQMKAYGAGKTGDAIANAKGKKGQ